jgi:hypothetical protein
MLVARHMVFCLPLAYMWYPKAATSSHTDMGFRVDLSTQILASQFPFAFTRAQFKFMAEF